MKKYSDKTAAAKTSTGRSSNNDAGTIMATIVAGLPQPPYTAKEDGCCY